LLTDLGAQVEKPRWAATNKQAMILFNPRLLTAALCAAVLISSAPRADAQSGQVRPPDQPPQADAGKDRQKEEFAEADRLLTGPAGKPECVWTGRLVVSLLWRDDLDTAFRHLELYDRFGCPANHIQSAFRCLLLQAPADVKNPESLARRVHACWITPATVPAAAVPPGRSKR